MITCKELRARARYSLDGKIFGKTWLFAILAQLIFGAIMGVSSVVPMGIGTLVVFGPLTVGIATYYLNMVRDTEEKNNFLSILFSFKVGKRYLLGVLQALYLALWSLLFVIPAIVKFFSYALAPYIMAENPHMSANEAITESRKMMDGNKANLFKLYLSFIGWFILMGVPVIGVAIAIWVMPYVQAAVAEFYEEVKRTHSPF